MTKRTNRKDGRTSKRLPAPSAEGGDPRWLLLIHQLPPKPAYFRAKVGRRLSRVGAVAIKNSVYALPLNEQTQEDLQWLAREITEEGGEVTLCSANLIQGLLDGQVEALFQAAREADYAQIAAEAREIDAELPPTLADGDERKPQLEASLARLRKRLAEVAAIDFFGAPGLEAAEAAIAALSERWRAGETASPLPLGEPRRAIFRGRTWVTRRNVHVDRIASAWLIRRFIDDRAMFAFVAGKGYRKKPDDVTFDMFEADFTHVGDRCTFEVLVDSFDLRTAGLSAIAEIVHDIDVKDSKFGRSEAPGIAELVAGIALAHADDQARVELGGRVFDALFELYRRKRA
jgi:hypothetical protein